VHERGRQFRSLGARLERPPNLDVSLPEARAVVLQAVLVAKRLHHLLAETSELVPRHPRHEVMLGLELEPPVEPVEPRRAVDVHRPVQLHLHPLVVLRPAVEDLAAEVAQADLHMDDAADGVREEEKAQSLARRQLRHQSAEPGEVEAHDANLQRL